MLRTPNRSSVTSIGKLLSGALLSGSMAGIGILTTSGKLDFPWEKKMQPGIMQPSNPTQPISPFGKSCFLPLFLLGKRWKANSPPINHSAAPTWLLFSRSLVTSVRPPPFVSHPRFAGQQKNTRINWASRPSI